MNIRYVVAVIIGVLIVTSSGSELSAQNHRTPESTVQAFYEWYIAYTTSEGDFRNPLVDRIYQNSEYVTPDLITHIDNQLESAGEMGIHYDLFLCAQDIPQDFRVQLIELQPESATVLLREYFGSPRSNNVTITLIKSAEEWQMNGVTCGDTYTPRGVAENFYEWYTGFWRSSPAPENPLTSGAYKSYPYLTDRLLGDIEESITNRELGGGDPVLCAQDIPQSFWVHEIDHKDGVANVLVQAFFTGNPVPHNLTATLIVDDPHWMLDQVTCGITPDKMAQLLYKEYAEQTRYNIDHGIEMDILRNPVPHWNRNVSNELLTHLIRESDNPEVLVDPVLCVQDIPERIVTRITNLSDTEATIEVQGEYPSGPDTNTTYPLSVVTMTLIDGQWVLTHIAGIKTCVA